MCAVSRFTSTRSWWSWRPTPFFSAVAATSSRCTVPKTTTTARFSGVAPHMLCGTHGAKMVRDPEGRVRKKRLVLLQPAAIHQPPPRLPTYADTHCRHPTTHNSRIGQHGDNGRGAATQNTSNLTSTNTRRTCEAHPLPRPGKATTSRTHTQTHAHTLSAGRARARSGGRRGRARVRRGRQEREGCRSPRRGRPPATPGWR